MKAATIRLAAQQLAKDLRSGVVALGTAPILNEDGSPSSVWAYLAQYAANIEEPVWLSDVFDAIGPAAFQQLGDLETSGNLHELCESLESIGGSNAL